MRCGQVCVRGAGSRRRRRHEKLLDAATGALVHDASVAQEYDAVRPGGVSSIVGDQDATGAGVDAAAQHPQHCLARRAVERAGRLVGQNQTRPVDHGARDRDALLLPAGEVIGVAVGAVVEFHRA